MVIKYGIKVIFKNGFDLFVESVSHMFMREFQELSIIGYDKKRYIIPMSSINYIEFDERFEEVIKLSESSSASKKDN